MEDPCIIVGLKTNYDLTRTFRKKQAETSLTPGNLTRAFCEGGVGEKEVGFKWTESEVFCSSYAKIRLSRSSSTRKAADDRKPQTQPHGY